MWNHSSKTKMTLNIISTPPVYYVKMVKVPKFYRTFLQGIQRFLLYLHHDQIIEFKQGNQISLGISWLEMAKAPVRWHIFPWKRFQIVLTDHITGEETQIGNLPPFLSIKFCSLLSLCRARAISISFPSTNASGLWRGQTKGNPNWHLNIAIHFSWQHSPGTDGSDI